MFLEKTKICYP